MLSVQFVVLVGLALDESEDQQVHEDDEHGEDHGGLRGAQHGAGVVEPVQEDGEEPAEEDVQPLAGLAVVLEVLGASVEDAHDDREGHVAGDGEDGAGKRDGQTITEHVLDVLERRKAQGHEHSVDDAVELVVEARVLPGLEVQEEQFRAFLHDRDDAEGQRHDVQRCGLVDLRHVQRADADALQGNGSKRRADAHEDAHAEQADRLLVPLVLLVNVVHENERRHDRGGEVDHENSIGS